MPPLSLHLALHSGFHVATYPAGATFGPRALQDWELVWIIEGDVEYIYNERAIEAPQGSIVLCRPGTTDFFRWDTRRRTRHGWFHFHLLGDIPEDWPAPETWPVVRIPTSENDLLPTLFRALVADASTGNDAPASSASHLLALTLLASFVSEGDTGSQGVENSQYPEPVTRAMAFIAQRLEERPTDPLPLPEIAHAAYVTPEHLCRLFKSVTGHSPAETVRLTRLDRAAVLLVRTNYTIGEIARLCGFDSPFHFARRFKDAFGQTPSDLRRAVASGHGTVPLSRLVRLAKQ